MISLSFHLLFPQCALFLGGVLSILSGQAGAEVREPQMSPLRTDRGLGLTVDQCMCTHSIYSIDIAMI